MTSSQFYSTSFFLSQWAQDDNLDKKRSLIELDIVEDPNTREVCSGSSCSLFFDSKSGDYVSTGKCNRGTLCTETRILKDGLFIQEGQISTTSQCVNFDIQLNRW